MKRILFIVFTILLFSSSSVAFASSHKVTPLVIDKDVRQRDIFSEIIRIENTVSYKISIFPAVNEILVDEGGDITGFVETGYIDDKSSAVTSWIKMSRAPIELMPGEVVELPVSFRIHQDAPAGHYRVLLSFGSGQNRTKAAQQVTEGNAPGVVVTLAVEQNLVESLKLGRFFVEKFVTEVENEAIQYTLTNPGETTITPTGEIIIYNPRGEEVGSVPVNPDQISLPPGQSSKLTAPVPVAGYLGKYKAFLSVDYGTSQAASVYDTVFYYVVPWQQLLIAFAVIMVIAVTLTILFARREEDDDDEHGAGYLPVHITEAVSEDQDHDINLKQQ